MYLITILFMFDTRRIKTLFGVLLVASLLVNSFAYAEKPDSQSMRPTSGWKDAKQMVSAENCTCTTVRASDKSEEHDGTSVSEKTVAKRYLSEKDRSSIVRKLEEIKPYQNLGFLEVVLARVKKLEGNISNSSMVSWRKVIQLGRLAEMRELIEARITELSGSGSTNLPDVKAPVVSALSVTGITSTTATFSVKTSESGTGYYVLLASGATAPSALQVKAGQDGMGVTATFKGSLVTIVGTSAFTVT